MEKPHGREAVKEAIIKASIPLFADMGIDRVSFREIAAAANVNHALITRHFGTKDELVNEVSQWLTESMFRDIRDCGQTIQSLWNSGFSGLSMEIRAMIRIMLDSSANLSNPHPTFIENVFKWFESEQARLNLKAYIDPNILMLLIASLMFGSTLIEPFLQRALGISADDFRELKSKAFQTFVNELQETPSSASRFGRRPKPLKA
jgi:AcrR family transcriptional regulator